MKTALLLAVAALAAAPAKTPVGGFIGHYGSVIEYPAGWRVLPQLGDPEGAVESIQFLPPTCADQPDEACLRAGWFQVLVMPKVIISRYNKLGSFDEFVKGVIAEYAGNGEKPRSAPLKRSVLKGVAVTLDAPSGPFDTIVYLEGRKVYYRFGYRRGNAAAAAAAKSRLEGAPAKPSKRKTR